MYQNTQLRLPQIRGTELDYAGEMEKFYTSAGAALIAVFPAALL